MRAVLVRSSAFGLSATDTTSHIHTHAQDTNELDPKHTYTYKGPHTNTRSRRNPFYLSELMYACVASSHPHRHRRQRVLMMVASSTTERGTRRHRLTHTDILKKQQPKNLVHYTCIKINNAYAALSMSTIARRTHTHEVDSPAGKGYEGIFFLFPQCACAGFIWAGGHTVHCVRMDSPRA